MVKLPSHLPAEVICPVNCATATVAAVYRAARSFIGKTVLIFGAGMLGITAAAMARTGHAKRIVVCDLDSERLELIQKFGADTTVQWVSDFDQLQERLRQHSALDAFDLVLELSGSPDAVEAAVGAAAIGGEVVLAGSVMNSRQVKIDPESVVRRCLSIRGVHNYAPEDLKSAVSFLIHHHTHFPFADLITHSCELTEINSAMEFAFRERPVRVAVRP